MSKLQLSTYGRPFHQRGAEMVLPPLTPYEVGEMTGLTAADAIDAHLVTGGSRSSARNGSRERTGNRS
ncbi:hypothetical protein [Yinghuangia sp. YIM S10712]|uniref:hypothetical protein n=1 Tax=Yinghuangia sp. YIM S10712 TaxID=3436930 RepID=UPI003F533EDD